MLEGVGTGAGGAGVGAGEVRAEEEGAEAFEAPRAQALWISGVGQMASFILRRGELISH